MDPTNLQAQGQRRQAPAAPRRYDGQNGNPLYDSANNGHYGAFPISRPACRSVWSHTQLNRLKLTPSQVPPLPYVLSSARSHIAASVADLV
jgi:hypothetical protein